MIAHVAQLNTAYATRADRVRQPIRANKQTRGAPAAECGTLPRPWMPWATYGAAAAVLRRRAACGGHQAIPYQALGVGYREATCARLSPACPCALQHRFEAACLAAGTAHRPQESLVCARLHAQERVRIFSYAFGVQAVFSDVQVGCKTDATLRAGCNLVCNSRSQRCNNNTPRWAKATLQRPRCVALVAVVCLFVCFAGDLMRQRRRREAGSNPVALRPRPRLLSHLGPFPVRPVPS
jgi:hypothetical protein